MNSKTLKIEELNKVYEIFVKPFNLLKKKGFTENKCLNRNPTAFKRATSNCKPNSDKLKVNLYFVVANLNPNGSRSSNANNN